MKNKGNQKHLTFEQRVDIEKGLTENKSFTEIGRIIGKNPSTIFILELCSKNTLYYEYCPPFVSYEIIEEDMNAIPPNVVIERKY